MFQNLREYRMKKYQLVFKIVIIFFIIFGLCGCTNLFDELEFDPVIRRANPYVNKILLNDIEIRAYANDTLNNIGANFSIYNITIDKQGPVTTIQNPINFSYISTNTYELNGSATDILNEVDTITFLYRVNDSSSWTIACSDNNEPYNCLFSFV